MCRSRYSIADDPDESFPIEPPISRRAALRLVWRVVSWAAMVVSAALVILGVLSMLQPTTVLWVTLCLLAVVLVGPDVSRLADFLARRERELRR